MESERETLSKQALIAQNVGLSQQVSQLKFELQQLKQVVFGGKTERFVPSQPPEQLSPGLPVEPAPVATTSQKANYIRQKLERNEKKPVRQALPTHMPRTEIIIEPEGDLTGLRKIREKITEKLEYELGRDGQSPMYMSLQTVAEKLPGYQLLSTNKKNFPLTQSLGEDKYKTTSSW